MLQAELHVDAFWPVHLLATSSPPANIPVASSGGSSGARQRPATTLLRQLAPQAAVVLRAVAAEPQYSEREEHLLVLCTCVSEVLPRVPLPQRVPLPEIADWATAADAGVRLLPLLSLQLSGLRPPPQMGTAAWADLQPARRLAHGLARLFVLGSQRLDDAGLDSQRGGSQPVALTKLLVQCHASGCRLLHWLAADPARPGQCGFEVPLHDILALLVPALDKLLHAISSLDCIVAGDVELR